ncbi:MAG: outer membrane lipoprotein carrier protein [Oceanicoccus sp.]
MTFVNPLFFSTAKFCALLSLVIGLLIPQAYAEQSDSAAVTALAANLLTMQSLSAHFEQEIKDADGETLQQASGELKVKRPRRFYWQTNQPYQHLAVTNGITMWLYDADLEQISKQPFTADLGKAPALLLSGEVDQISAQYHVVLKSAENDQSEFILSPKTDDTVFQQLSLVFAKGGLRSMNFIDNFEQSTQIIFSKLQLNVEIDDQQFEFIAPDGIDVISNEP